jgi:hypothetical protein
MIRMLFFLLLTGRLCAQDTHVRTIVTCRGTTVEPGDTIAGGVVLQRIRFYLSDFRFYLQGKEVFREPDSYHLIDPEVPESMQFSVPVSSYSEVRFSLGIDSLTNVSGAYGGDLDPTKGMYWTWNSGYINVKLEGFSPNSQGRNGSFAFHLGGYMPPNQTVFPVVSEVMATGRILINTDVCNMLDQADWTNHFNVMSPSQEAARLAGLIGKSIRVNAE